MTDIPPQDGKMHKLTLKLENILAGSDLHCEKSRDIFTFTSISSQYSGALSHPSSQQMMAISEVLKTIWTITSPTTKR